MDHLGFCSSCHNGLCCDLSGSANLANALIRYSLLTNLIDNKLMNIDKVQKQLCPFPKIVLLFLFLMNSIIYGQELITDRPDQTESSSTIPVRSLQIESGLLLGFAEGEEISLREILAPTTLFRYGVTKGFEIRVVNQLISIKDKNTEEEYTGIGDLEVGAKIQLLRKEGINTEIAFLSHVVLPTGTEEVSIGNYGTINKLSISHKLTENIGVGYNVGYNYFGIDNGFFTYSLAFGIGLTEKAGVYLETYGNVGILDEFLANFDAGFTYLLKPNFQLDFSFGTGINYTMNYISAGFSWNIGMMKKTK